MVVLLALQRGQFMRSAWSGLLVLGLFAGGCREAEAPKPAPSPVVAPPPPKPEPPPVVAGKPLPITPGFVVIPKGKFTMGIAKAEAAPEDWDAPAHEVELTRSFEMQKTEVTVSDYTALMAATAEQKQGQPTWPAVHVSWNQAATYCNQLSKRYSYAPCYQQTGLDMLWYGPDCQGFRLPTEAEWEYAARGGTTGQRYGELAAIAWTQDNSSNGDAGMQRHPVGQLAANPWGLHDMLGNVAEWVWDYEGPYAVDAVQTNPKGPDKAANRVFRGGSYKYPAAEARAGFRAGYGAGNQVEFIGFRCVRTLQTDLTAPAAP